MKVVTDVNQSPGRAEKHGILKTHTLHNTYKHCIRHVINDQFNLSHCILLLLIITFKFNTTGSIALSRILHIQQQAFKGYCLSKVKRSPEILHILLKVANEIFLLPRLTESVKKQQFASKDNLIYKRCHSCLFPDMLITDTTCLNSRINIIIPSA